MKDFESIVVHFSTFRHFRCYTRYVLQITWFATLFFISKCQYANNMIPFEFYMKGKRLLEYKFHLKTFQNKNVIKAGWLRAIASVSTFLKFWVCVSVELYCNSWSLYLCVDILFSPIVFPCAVSWCHINFHVR